AQILHIRVPVVIRLEAKQRWRRMGMSYFTERVGSVGWRRHKHPRLRTQTAINFCDGVPKPVKENDVVGGDPGTATAVGGFADKFPGLKHTTGMAITPGTIVHCGPGDYFLHPLRNDLALDNRIANILPV